MKGHYDRVSGEIVLRVCVNSEKLEAPPTDFGERRHWLPCEVCGEVSAVLWNVVAHVCSSCASKKAGE